MKSSLVVLLSILLLICTGEFSFASQPSSLFAGEADLVQVLTQLLNSAERQPATPSTDVITVGIPSEIFETKADPEGRGRQQCSMWCWAAATQMVMDYYGVTRPQNTIAAQYGVNADGAGTVESTLAANTGEFLTTDGRTIKFAAKLAQSPDEIIEDLRNERPLIIGINNQYLANSGHEYVLTAVQYVISPATGRPKIVNLILRNPWPNRPSRMEFDVTTQGSRVDHVIRVLPEGND